MKRGYTFNSGSDTEVVLRMYEAYGDDFVKRMRGMFALAVYDKRRGPGHARLLIARDHLGIKPLLYARSEGRFIFASEMKALLASSLIERSFHPEALLLLLTHGSIPQPLTAVEGVEMLLPGHLMIIERGGEKIERYWQLDINRMPELRRSAYQEQVQIVKHALEESVRLQMVSDVPIGAFLSGGLDSSLLVALMTRVHDSRVKTFSVGFEQEGSDIDETDAARKIAHLLGTDHTRVQVTGADVRDRITHIARALDQPSVDGINSYFVSLAARQGLTVAISGTGGDELFAGYPWFLNMAKAAYSDSQRPYWHKIEYLASSLARHAFFNPLVGTPVGSMLERIRGMSGFVPRYARQYQIFGPRGTARTLSREIRHQCSVGQEPSHDRSFVDALPNGSPVERTSALCLMGYTQNQLLRDIDAVSMSHSLEVRVPFLDPVILDMALSLPDSTKLGDPSRTNGCPSDTYRATGAKRILKDIGFNMLPGDIDLQPKRGFGMPFHAWLTGPLRDVLEDTLAPETIHRRGFFDAVQVEKEKKAFFDGTSYWAYPWLLMITELWCREVLDRQ
jgi:asparagine synthase (glutamine-hydrolysing)